MSTSMTVVVLDVEGSGLLSGSLEDFILSPSRGSFYFYNGNLYEVIQTIETIGNASSAQGSVLVDLLGLLYRNHRQVTSLFHDMKRIGDLKSVDASAQTVTLVTTGDGAAMGVNSERLLYVKLKRMSKQS